MIREHTDDPILVAVYDYWNRKAGTRAMPVRRDIDPIEMPREALPFVAITEYVDGGRRVRFRLVGTRIVENLGGEARERYIDEIFSGTYLDFIASLFADVRASRAPVFSESVFRWDRAGFKLTRRLYMPLGATEPEQVLIAQTFGPPAVGRAPPKKTILGMPHQEEHRRATVARAAGGA